MMKVSAIKISVLGLTGLCLLMIFLNGTVVSENEPVAAEPNQPAAVAEQSAVPVATERQAPPVAAEPDRPRRGAAARPDGMDRGLGGRQDGMGMPRGGFGMPEVDGAQRFPRPGPVTVLGEGDPNTPMEAINLNNIEMRQVVQKLAEWTGKPVIPVNDEIMQTRVTIYSPSMVTRPEALSLLIMALQARGIVVEQLDNRVMLRPLASVRLGSVPTLGPDEPLARVEDKSQVVEKWFHLDNYDPARLVEIVKPLIPDYGYSVADQGTSRVGIIDTVENLMRIERLIAQLDLPESGRQFESVITLRYADPSEVVQVLQLILADSQAVAGTADPRARRDRRTQPESGATVVIEGAGGTPIRMIPLVRQQQIIVRAGRDDLARIEEWAQRLDIEDEDEMKQTVVQVRYANVTEVVRMVQNTLQQMPGTDLRTNIVVEALVQTSQVVIYGSDSNRATVERLIAQIDLPKEDFFVERTFRLKHADPDQIKTHIEQLYSETAPAQQQQFGRLQATRTTGQPEDTVRVIAYTMLKQVTVIASPQNMERIARQIEEEWDKPLDITQDQYRIINLNNSDPVKLADLLKRLFSEEAGTAAGNQNLVRMIFGGTTQDSRQKIIGSLYGMLTFEPVPDSKKLIVISQVPEAYDVIEQLIHRLDARDEADVPRVITLKYADPEALCEQLNAILNEPGTQTTIQRSARGLSAYDATQPTQAVATSDEGGGNVITPWWTRQRLDTSQMPTSNLIGRVRFVPVHRSKAILVVAPPEYSEDISNLIRELDRPVMQVMIKAVIVEINLSDMTSLGIQLANNEFTNLGPNALSALSSLLYRGPQSGSDARRTESSPTHFSAVTGADIAVLVDLLVRNANGRVLNQPTLWTKDNEEAVFVKGRRVAFITGEQTASTGSSQISYDFEDVGVTLRVRPRITPEKAVDLTINLNISKLESEEVANQNVRSNLDSTTHMIINEGQSVMMGGILEQNDDFIQHKIPLLGDLPLLGGLFRHEANVKVNNELLIFITPYVFDEEARAAIPTEEIGGMEIHERSRQRLGETVDSMNHLFIHDKMTVPGE